MIDSVRTPILEELVDETELARSTARQARFDRNLRWFQDHAVQIGATCRGKCICIAGEQLFVADAPEQAVALAQAAHPEDDGFFLHYIYREQGARIYAAARGVAPMR
jgi:hypothetical protein